jgi:hypothetical protein
MMKGDSKAIGCGVLAVLGGIGFIVTARLLAEHVSWGVGWIINAIGWLTIAAVIIPLCEHVKKRKGAKK